MVRDSRIKEYRFPIGSLTSASDGTLDVYTPHPLNGELLAIQNYGGNDPGSWIKTGSLTFSISGTQSPTIYVWKSGTATSNTGIIPADTQFPRAVMRGTAGSVLTAYDKIPLNSVVRLEGAGLGAVKSGLGINLVYQ